MRIGSSRVGVFIAAFFAASLLSLSIATAQQAPPALDDIGKTGVLKAGWTTWYPYVYRDPQTKELNGASVKIVEDIAKRLDVKLEWVEENAATAIAGLQSGKFHIYGAPMAITLPRARAATYTEPFLQTKVGALVRKDDLSKYASWKDLDKKGIKVCFALGTNVDTWATRIFQNVEFIRVKETTMCITELLSRKADAQLTGTDSFPKTLAEHPNIAAVPGEAWMSGKVGYIVRFGDFTMRDWLNYYFDEMKRTGELERLLVKYGLDATFIYRTN